MAERLARAPRGGTVHVFVVRMRAVDTRVVLLRGEGDWLADHDIGADIAAHVTKVDAAPPR